MVEYNEAGMKFYEKNEFSMHRRVEDHYMIEGKSYASIVYYKRIRTKVI